MSAHPRVIVITGASSGIGRATALRFARRGDSVVLAARREHALESLAAECRELGARALAAPTDVTDAEAVHSLADTALAEFGRIDVWINDASVAFFSPFLEVPLDEFRRVLEVNVMGYVHGARAALPVLQRQKRGVLINVASIVGEIPQPYTSAYSMAKAAVRALSVSLRSELRLQGHRGVKIVTIMPASIDTPFFQHAANHTGRQVRAMPPVNSPDRVAAKIVSAANRPRREIPAGALGRSMIVQHRIAPRLMETFMAFQVENGHLSHSTPGAESSGNLFAPSANRELVSTHGGWGGRRATVRRRVIGTALLVAGGGALLLRRSR